MLLKEFLVLITNFFLLECITTQYHINQPYFEAVILELTIQFENLAEAGKL